MLRETIDGLNHGSYADSIVHAFVMGKHHLDEIDAAWDLGVTSFKHFYTAYGRRKHEDAGLGALFAPVDNDVLLESMWRIAAKGSPGLAMVHAEDGDLVTAVSANVSESGRSDLAAWSEGRPAIAEALRAHQAIHLLSGPDALCMSFTSPRRMRAVRWQMHARAVHVSGVKQARTGSPITVAWRGRSGAGAR